MASENVINICAVARFLSFNCIMIMRSHKSLRDRYILQVFSGTNINRHVVWNLKNILQIINTCQSSNCTLTAFNGFNSVDCIFPNFTRKKSTNVYNINSSFRSRLESGFPEYWLGGSSGGVACREEVVLICGLPSRGCGEKNC